MDLISYFRYQDAVLPITHLHLNVLIKQRQDQNALLYDADPALTAKILAQGTTETDISIYIY